MHLALLPLLAFTALTAHAGIYKVDFKVIASICPETSSEVGFMLRKKLNMTTTDKAITFSQFSDLVVSADSTTCTAFDTEASAELGTWYTNMAQSDRDNLCAVFMEIADAD